MENKIFIEHLPRKGKYIDWKNTVGFEIRFKYDNIEGYLVIEEYIKPDRLKVLYKDSIVDINTRSLVKCRLKYVVNSSQKYRYNRGDSIKRK